MEGAAAEEEGELEWSEEDLLDSLEAADAPPEPSAAETGETAAVQDGGRSIGEGLVSWWPAEVRVCVASFLPWQELVRHTSRICSSWRTVEASDVLWHSYFVTSWPRWSRRRAANSEGTMPWRALFRARWANSSHAEDAVEEDWLDFTAAQAESSPSGGLAKAQLAALDLQQAVRRCREELRRKRGVEVPTEAPAGHLCCRKCRFHRLDLGGDCFLCEESGQVHRCNDSRPCDLCINDDDHCTLVCPVSGRCFHYLRANGADQAKEEDAGFNALTWDPELSMTEQYGRWFEQGYFMSEEQAKDFFGHAPPRKVRRLQRA